MQNRRVSRRRFLFLSALGLAAGAGSWWSRRPVGVGLIGAGKQGEHLAFAVRVSRWLGGPAGRIIALCDVDQEHARRVQQAHCPRAERYTHHERLLERDDVEAVLVATPDHWHARIAHDALRAGKAVYCEKPLGLTIAEGRTLVEAVAETGQVFQGGTMQRSNRRFATACRLVREGKLGKVHEVTVTLPVRWVGKSPGPFRPRTPPAHLDWERWLGQAPLVDYCPQRCHGFFRRWYDYSGGQLTDWGAHHLDAVAWALGLEDCGSVRVEARGRMPSVPGGYDTPLHFQVRMDLPGGVALRIRSEPEFRNNGIRFVGERGWLEVNRDRLAGPIVSGRAWLESRWGWGPNHFVGHLRQFFACVRHGSRPVSDVSSLHRASTLCHLANIAMRLGRPIRWDASREEILADAEANAMRSRPAREGYGLSG